MQRIFLTLFVSAIALAGGLSCPFAHSAEFTAVADLGTLDAPKTSVVPLQHRLPIDPADIDPEAALLEITETVDRLRRRETDIYGDQGGLLQSEIDTAFYRIQQLIPALDGVESALKSSFSAERSSLPEGRRQADLVAEREILERYKIFSRNLKPLEVIGASAKDREKAIFDLLASAKAFSAEQPRILADYEKVVLPGQQEDAREPESDAVRLQAMVEYATLKTTAKGVVSSEIANLVASLGNDPLSIFNWVRNNIAYQPTHGAIQPVDLTLRARSGNGIDTNALLATMLEIAGIDVRYRYGTIDVPADRFANWVGVPDDVEQAYDLLNAGGVPSALVYSGNAIVAVRMEHLWVEAHLDYIPSRGTVNREPDSWVPLDASFKQYEYAGPAIEITVDPFPMADIVEQVEDSATSGPNGSFTNADLTIFNDAIVNHVRNVNAAIESYPDAELADFLPSVEIQNDDLVSFPGSLPYTVIAQASTTSPTVPASLQYELVIRAFSSAQNVNFGAYDFEHRAPLNSVGDSRVQVTYAPASQADADYLDQLVQNNASTLSANAVRVIPELKIDGQVVANGGARRLGTTEYWTVSLVSPSGQSYGYPTPYQWPAGSPVALVIDPAGTPVERVEEHLERLPATERVPIEDALHMSGLAYWNMTHTNDRSAEINIGGKLQRLPSIGAFYSPLTVTYFFGVPRNASFQGFTTDVKSLTYAITAPDQQTIRQLLRFSGAASSFYESEAYSVAMGFDDTESISASAVMVAANDAGIPIYQIDSSNVNTVLPTLQLTADSAADIRNAVDAGYVAVVPERDIEFSGWTGIGYLILDPATNSGLYQLDGGLNGGIKAGCLNKAMLLDIYLDRKITQLLRKKAVRQGLRLLLSFLAPPPVGLILGVVAAVQIGIEIIMTTAEVMKTYRMMKATDDIAGLAAYLGFAVVEHICSKRKCGSKRGKKKASRRKKNCCGAGAGGGGGPGGPGRGKPILIGSGEEELIEPDYEGEGVHPLYYERLYNSQFNQAGRHGMKWLGTFDRRIFIPDDAVSPPRSVLVYRDDGAFLQFDRDAQGNYTTASGQPAVLTRNADGSWVYHSMENEIEQFSADGRLLIVRGEGGMELTLTYTAGRLTQVTNQSSRSLRFEYNANDLISAMVDPLNRRYTYAYDEAGNLLSVTYPDLTVRRYHYEDPTLTNHLTGVTDERGIRIATIRYDLQGRATETTGPDGSDRYQIRYGENTSIVTDPLGTVRTYRFTVIAEQLYMTEVAQPCSACGAGSASHVQYDAQGFPREIIDFNGNVTRLTYNSRGLEESKIEAFGTPQQRTTTTSWHPTWDVPIQIREPSATGTTRTTTSTYDADGNELTRSVSVDGETRTWTWTYNAFGQTLTEDRARTDVTDVTTYTYDAQGNLRTMVNAAGHETTYDTYDADGKLLQMTDPNGLITVYTFDDRDRLSEANVGGEVTEYAYLDNGNLDRLTLPDASYLDFDYDDADRLIGIQDNLGHRVQYTLDAMGNRVVEDIFDPSDTLVQRVRQSFDALSRLETITGADGQVTRYGRDDNGNETSVTDPLMRTTTSTYDALNRLRSITDPDLHDISYTYDALDNLRTVVDPRNLTTSYMYNGFDELTQLDSPDTGVTENDYNAAGNITLRTDARNVESTYTYDALDRLTSITYPDETIAFTYDELSGGDGRLGNLTTVTDASGSTRYAYDRDGRVIQKSQAVNGSSTLSLGYTYNDDGQMVGMTMPSGVEISYGYRSDGRVLTITINGVTVVREVDYFAFGEPSGWTYGPASSRYERTFDGDGRIATHTAGSTVRNVDYDPASRIVGLSDADSGHDWTYGYDDLDRLTSAINAGSDLPITQSWDYDPTGNRQVQTSSNAGLLISSKGEGDYTIGPDSNRLASVAGQTRQNDNVGNLIDDGEFTFVYSGRNRLVQVQAASPVATYQYNSFGERVSKQTSALTQFIYDEEGRLVGEYDQSGNLIAEHVWLGDSPLAVIQPPGGSGQQAGAVEVYFVHPDHLDTPRAIVDAASSVVWEWNSTPFGDVEPSGPLEYGLRFPGQYYDEETGSNYNYFRDYEAGTGRYRQSDPIGLNDGPNTYSYVGSDPAYYTDSSGTSRSYGGRMRNVGNPHVPKCPPCKADKRSHQYKGLKHVYELYNKRTGEIFKVGTGSGKSLRRCMSQRRIAARVTGTRKGAWNCRLVGYVCGTKRAETVEFLRQNDLRMRGHSLRGNQPRPRPR